MYLLIVSDGNAGNETAHFRSDDGYVTTDICIVSALDEATDRPPVVTKHGGRHEYDECSSRHEQSLPRRQSNGSGRNALRYAGANAIHIELRSSGLLLLRRF